MGVIRDCKGNNLWAFPRDYTVIDIETTGISPTQSAIIEVSALQYRDETLVDTYSTLLNPHCHIDWFITRLTGINDAMVRDAPDADAMLPLFYRFVGKDILIGHNVNFDINFLYDNLLAKCGMVLDNDYVDVLRLARKALPDLPNHKQTTVAQHFGVSAQGAHRALRDCEICNANYLHLKRMLEQQ